MGHIRLPGRLMLDTAREMERVEILGWGAAIMELNIMIPNLEMRKLRHIMVTYISQRASLSINGADI